MIPSSFYRSCRRWKWILLLPCLVFLFMYVRSPSCLTAAKRVKEELAESGKSCEILECTTETQCEGIKRKQVTRVNRIQEELQQNRCTAVLNSVWRGSEEELDTPLAFSILTHRDFPQFYRLLEAVYRPQNLYCVQIDSKSSQEYYKLVKSLVDCLAGENQNIFISKRNISLIWQHSSLLEGDLYCLEQLLEKSHPWKFYVNIVGSEFPLKTNLQLIRKLREVKNNVGFVNTIQSHEEVKLRWKYSHVLPKENSGLGGTTFFGSYYKNVPYRTKILKTAPPQNLTIMYGLKNAAITREFGEFVIYADISKELRVWMEDVLVAVEHFYPTLATVFVNNQHKDQKEQKISQDFSTMEELNRFPMRITYWQGGGNQCRGEIRREICVLSLSDLPQIVQEEGFIMNKFDSDFDSSVVDCLSEMIRNS